jgi:hypothetical protein
MHVSQPKVILSIYNRFGSVFRGFVLPVGAVQEGKWARARPKRRYSPYTRAERGSSFSSLGELFVLPFTMLVVVANSFSGVL